MNLQSLAKLYDSVVGINKRNINYIYENNPRRYFPVANDKALTKEYLEKASVPVPDTFFVIRTMGGINEYWEKIIRLKEFAIKPAKGKAGGGILVLERDKDGWLDPSGRLHGPDEIRKHMADIIFGIHSFGLWDKVIIEYRIRQHKFFNAIFPAGVADIRVITHRGVPKMCMARIPTEKSGGKANLHQGAIGVAIDLKTGKLGEGFDKKGYFKKHPDTGVTFYGMKIPLWKKILKMSAAAGNAVPLKYIGVDVVMDEKKGPLVIEINARPGLEIQNVNRKGLLEVLEAAHA